MMALRSEVLDASEDPPGDRQKVRAQPLVPLDRANDEGRADPLAGKALPEGSDPEQVLEGGARRGLDFDGEEGATELQDQVDLGSAVRAEVEHIRGSGPVLEGLHDLENHEGLEKGSQERMPAKDFRRVDAV